MAQLYVASRMITPELVFLEDDMLDFADIGGVYDNLGEAANNTSRLQSFLNDQGDSQGIHIMFTGPRLSTANNKRQPGVAYFDVSGGPITNSATNVAHADVSVIGMKGAVIEGVGTPVTPATPLFELARYQGSFQAIQFEGLTIRNAEGSGLKLVGTAVGQGPGVLCIVKNCRFEAIGTSLVSPPMDWDGWTDLNTAVYGIFIDESDGAVVKDVVVDQCIGHGMIVDRWHEGKLDAMLYNCVGSGLKATRMNGCTVNLRSESNRGWGMHLKDCGNRFVTTAASFEAGAANAWEVWFENNNYRNTVHSHSGHGNRQCRIEASSRLTIGSQSGWKFNKIYMSEAVRRCNRFVDTDYINPSPGDGVANVVYSLNDDDFAAPGTGYDNWTTQWPDAQDRPSVTGIGDAGSGTRQFDLFIPAGAYDSVATANTSYWFPAGAAQFAVAADEMVMWEAEIEDRDGNAAAYCNTCEQDTQNRQKAYLGNIGPNVSGNASLNYALWNQSPRKFADRVFFYQADTTRLVINVYFSGMEAQGLGSYPESDITIRFKSLKAYVIKEGV